MITVAFFNNKGGVGKTTLVYHLSYMFAKLGFVTLAVDLDPQANLTSAFFDEEKLESLWESEEKDRDTIIKCIYPILEGTGDIEKPECLVVTDNLFLIAGDLALSRFEDKLSASWPLGHSNDTAALRATTAFHRIIQKGAKETDSDIALIDVGPNLGAINRAALLSADYIVIPLAADLFSLQGLRNLGPIVRAWRLDWKRMVKNARMDFPFPRGYMKPAGYVILQHAVRLDRPTRAFGRWLRRIPAIYREYVLGKPEKTPPPTSEQDAHCLTSIRNYRSLMPMAQDARKPIFDLKPADGVVGGHDALVKICRNEFKILAEKIAERIDLSENQR